MRQRTLVLVVAGISFVAAFVVFRLLRPENPGTGAALPVVAGLESSRPAVAVALSSGAVDPTSDTQGGRASAAPTFDGQNQRALADVSRNFAELADCRSQHRCPNGMECARSSAGALGCYVSNCTGLGDFSSCAQDESCVEVAPQFFRCAPAGFLEEGEACVDRQSANVARRCRAGLLCVAGLCSPPCREGATCASPGATCLDASAGKFCVPSDRLCDARRPCPDGKACLADERAGTSVCVTATPLPSGQPGCVPGSCPQGQVCAGARWGGQFYGRCLSECSTRQCPENKYCAPADLQKLTGPHVCHPTCTPPGTECGEDGQCVFNARKNIGLCATMMPYDDTTNTLDEWDSVFPPTPDAFPSPR